MAALAWSVMKFARMAPKTLIRPLRGHLPPEGEGDAPLPPGGERAPKRRRVQGETARPNVVTRYHASSAPASISLTSSTWSGHFARVFLN